MSGVNFIPPPWGDTGSKTLVDLALDLQQQATSDEARIPPPPPVGVSISHRFRSKNQLILTSLPLKRSLTIPLCRFIIHPSWNWLSRSRSIH